MQREVITMRLLLTHSCSNLTPHFSRRPGRQQALDLAATHRGIVTFTESKKILKRLGLQIDSTTFYNLQRKEMIGQLSDQEEARMLLQHLEGKKSMSLSTRSIFLT
jgi:hypothetical protein